MSFSDSIVSCTVSLTCRGELLYTIIQNWHKKHPGVYAEGPHLCLSMELNFQAVAMKLYANNYLLSFSQRQLWIRRSCFQRKTVKRTKNRQKSLQKRIKKSCMQWWRPQVTQRKRWTSLYTYHETSSTRPL